MNRYRTAAVLTIGLICLGACDEPDAPSVPRLATSSGTAERAAGQDDQDDNPNAVAGDAGADRRAKLHAAAQCVRTHGAPNYQDPVLTSDGYVYTDDVSLRSLDGPQLDAATTACQDLIHAANFSIRDQGPAPTALIQAGVKSAECLRAHGLPDFKDPTANSHFSPGKGFGLDSANIPPGGKQNPTLRRAVDACRAVLDAEAAASSLGNLGHA
jgi:hypothetical protein